MKAVHVELKLHDIFVWNIALHVNGLSYRLLLSEYLVLLQCTVG